MKETKSKEYQWADFYAEFANKLLAFADDRKPLVEIIKEVYEEIGINLPILEKDGKVFDIDPFTVYGLFNKGITKENRIKIITALDKKLDVAVNVPTHFAGVPVLNNQTATFYWFIGNRGDDDIENLWKLFIAALEYADKKTAESREKFIKYYDLCLKQKGVKWNITMGLYWVRPYTYMNLDSVNRDFIKKPENTTTDFAGIFQKVKHVPSGEEYLKLCKATIDLISSGGYEYNTFPEISSYARNAYKEEENTDTASKRFWTYSPGENASGWEEFYKDGIMAIGWKKLGDLSAYKSKEEIQEKMVELYGKGSHMNDALACWQFVKELRRGDIVFAKRGTKEIIGRGIVEGDYYFNENAERFSNRRKIKWTHNNNFEPTEKLSIKTLTDITKYSNYVDEIEGFFAEKEKNQIIDDEKNILPGDDKNYSENDFLREVFLSKDDYRKLSRTLTRKKNIILQGPPGVGKTFASTRLAYAIIGDKIDERIEFVQFHQNYSYEDFVMGYKPDGNGFSLKKGIFYNFCKKAEQESDKDFFFIIDEINRGNMSKIFGELLMAIEADYRGKKVRLAYGQQANESEYFSVPENVYIIGMMNTADRSLALIDYALRRRFAFFELKPGFETEGFKKYKAGLNNKALENVIAKIKEVNEEIRNDESLGEGFCIGHSYLCGFAVDGKNRLTDEALRDIVEFDILPTLKEYWFDNQAKYDEYKNVEKWLSGKNADEEVSDERGDEEGQVQENI